MRSGADPACMCVSPNLSTFEAISTYADRKPYTDGITKVTIPKWTIKWISSHLAWQTPREICTTSCYITSRVHLGVPYVTSLLIPMPSQSSIDERNDKLLNHLGQGPIDLSNILTYIFTLDTRQPLPTQSTQQNTRTLLQKHQILTIRSYPLVSMPCLLSVTNNVSVGIKLSGSHTRLFTQRPFFSTYILDTVRNDTSSLCWQVQWSWLGTRVRRVLTVTKSWVRQNRRIEAQLQA